jgi:hypothetical protein
MEEMKATGASRRARARRLRYTANDARDAGTREGERGKARFATRDARSLDAIPAQRPATPSLSLRQKLCSFL